MSDFDLNAALKRNEDRLQPYLIGENMNQGSQAEEDTQTPNSDPLAFPSINAGVAGDFAKVFAGHTEAPEEFYYISFLTCLGAIASDKVTLRSEISPEPRLYSLILGESADVRKSTAISKTINFFKDTMTDFPVCFGIGSAEGLQKKLEENNRLLLCFDEFRAFVSKCKIESSVLMPCVTTLYESRHYESHTVNKSITIERASLSLLAASTVDTYENIFDDHFLAIGFPNRLFLIPGVGSRKFSFPEPISFEDRQYLKKRLGEVLNHIGRGLDLDITDEGRELFHQWYMNLPISVHSKRLDGYALRFMALFTVNELKTVIDAEIVQKVTALCDWQYRVRRRYDPIDADSKMARIEEKIRRVLETGPRSKRDLARATNANRIGLWMFDNALQNLMKSQEIIFDRKAGIYALKK